MYYYVYQITNNINHKIYVGVHKTANLDDGYMGSGKIIKHAIEKYGVENFQKDIIQMCSSYEEALELEKQIVTDEFLLREDVYNLRRGGYGGFDFINSNGLNYLQNNPKFGPNNHFYGKHHTGNTKAILSEKTRQYKSGVPLTNEHKQNIAAALKGHSISEETKLKISQANKGKVAYNKGVSPEPWTCPHCGKVGRGAGNRVRYHFDNCKEK